MPRDLYQALGIAPAGNAGEPKTTEQLRGVINGAFNDESTLPNPMPETGPRDLYAALKIKPVERKAPDYYATGDKEAYRPGNILKDPGEKLGEGAVRGIKERSLGVMQLINDLVDQKLIDPKALEGMAAQYRAEGTGTGASGFVGEVGGDPTSYLPGSPVIAGAVGGAIEPMVDGDNRAVNMAVGATLGGVADTALKLVKKTAGPLGKDIAGMVGITTPAQRSAAAYKDIAQQLGEEGVRPAEVIAKMARSTKTGVPLTLPEAVGSPAMITDQKALAKLTPQTAKIFDVYNKERPAQVREAIRNLATPIAQRAKAAGAGYDDLFAKTDGKPVDVTRLKGELAMKVNDANPGGVKERFLKDISGIISGAEKRGGDMRAFHEAQWEISAKIKEAPEGIQKSLSALAAGVQRDMKKTLYKANPEYLKLDKEYRAGMAGQEILGEITGTPDTYLKTLRNRIFGSEDKRLALERSIGPDAFRGLKDIVEAMDDMLKGGMAGSDTKPLTAAAERLQERTGSKLVTTATQPLNSLKKLGDLINDRLRAKDYETIMEIYLHPDVARLGAAMRGAKPKSPAAFKALDATAEALAKQFAIQGADPENRP